MSEEIKMDEININVANYLIPDKESFYVHLTHDSGYALPAFESRCISRDYLEGISQGRFYCLKYPNFSPMRLLKPLIPKKKGELHQILMKLIPLNTELGFDFQRLPDKKWLLDMIHSLKPDHEIFVGHQADKNAFSISRKIPLGRKCCIFILLFIFNDQSGNCLQIYPLLCSNKKGGGFLPKNRKREETKKIIVWL